MLKKTTRKIIGTRIIIMALILSFIFSTFTLRPQVTSADVVQTPAAPFTYKYPFQNPSLSVAARVDDLLPRLTLDEKITLLHQYEAAIVRLGIPAFRTGSEGLHGISWLGTATIFPQGTGLSTTWDKDLIKEIGDAVGTETRAYNVLNNAHNGINLWSPNTDLTRDPRAGRNPENMGEDPYLTGAMSSYYAMGMKGDDPLYYKTIATLKHFVAYNQEVNRSSVSAGTDPRNQYEYYFKAFEPSIVSGAANSIMTSYNLVNGKPVMVMPEINDDIFGKWVAPDPDNFFVVTDAGSPSNLTGSNAYYINNNYGVAKAYADSIKSGVASMSQDSQNPANVRNAIYEALVRGFLQVSDIDRVVRQILTIRIHAGDMEVNSGNPYKEIKATAIDLPSSRELALKAAEKQVVLLKNTNNALPLNKNTINKVAVIGPNSDEVTTDFYAGTYPYKVSIYDGVKNIVDSSKIAFSRGLDQIALQPFGTSRYVTAPTGNGGNLTASATSIGVNETFDVYDYGWKSFLLRAHSNDKYITTTPNLSNTGRAPGFENGQGTQEWATNQNFDYTPQGNDTYRLRFPRTNDKSGTGNYALAGTSSPYNVIANGTTATATNFTQVIVKSGTADAVEAATGANAAVVVVGDQPMLNSRETVDRDDIILPPSQEALINQVASVNTNTIVVCVCSYPMAMPNVQNNPNVKAILYSTHAGQEQGNAIANVLFGNYAPSGRLNQTWYNSMNDLTGAITEYDVIKNKRTYQYFDGTALYPFGHGLTYTTFDYTNFKLSSASVNANGQLTASVDVTNTGTIASDEVVQLYSHAQQSRVTSALKQLKGFERINLAPGQTKTVTFPLKASDLAIWDVTRSKYTVETGNYDIMIGRSSGDIKSTKVLAVSGEIIPSRNLSLVTRAENYDDYSGVTTSNSFDDGGNMVAVTGANAWIKFKDTDLGTGVSNIITRVSSASAAGTAEVRLDNPTTGTLVGTIDIASTGNKQTWVTRTATINAAQAKGKHDVYLVFPSSGINMSWFKFDNTVYTPQSVQITSILPGTLAANRAPIQLPDAIKQWGGTLQMTAQVLPDTSSTPSVIWSVVDPSNDGPTTIATISNTGLLTGGKAADGNVKVVATATLPDSTTVKGTKIISVTHQSSSTQPPELLVVRSGISTNNSNEYLYHAFEYDNYGSIYQKNGTLQMNVTYYPSTTTTKTVAWSVTNEDGTPTTLATISATGLLTAVGNGKVKVTATATDSFYGAVASDLVTIQGQENKDAKSRIEAELFDSATGTIRKENIGGTDNGLMLNNVTAGNYAKFAAVDFGSNVKSFTARLASSANAANITLRLDDPTTGTIIGTLPVAKTSDIYTYSSQSTAITGAIGVHDLYMVFDSANVNVNWIQFYPSVESIMVHGLNDADTIATNGGKLKMVAEVSPSNASNQSVTWGVYDANYNGMPTGNATIDETGMLTALLNGSVKVVATANDGSEVSGEALISITGQIVSVDSITVSGAGGATGIITNQGTLQMIKDVQPSNADDTTVTWSVKDTSGNATNLASINTSGLLKANGNGTVVVTATANDGSLKFGQATITISNQLIPVNSISISGTGGAAAITTGQGTLQMVKSVLPIDASDSTVTWTVKDTNGNVTDIASIDTAGLLTANHNGIVVVTATANDGTLIKGEATITISNQVEVSFPVESITVTGASGATTITASNGTLQMNAGILPLNASNSSVTWSVTDPANAATSAASISSSGLLTATGNGTVKVTATAADGSNITGEATIVISGQIIAPVAPHWTNGSVTATNISQHSLTLSWTGASDSVGVTQYRIFSNDSELAVVTDSSYTVNGLSAGTSYTFKVQAGNAAELWSNDGPTVAVSTSSGTVTPTEPTPGPTPTTVPTPTPTPTPMPTPSPTPIPKLEVGSAAIVKPVVSFDSATNIATSKIDSSTWNDILQQFNPQAGSNKKVSIEIAEVPSAKAYVQNLPAIALNSSEHSVQVEISTSIASITVPSNMFKGTDLPEGDISLHIERVDTSNLNQATKSLIGDHPVIELSVQSGDKTIAWSNPDAPIHVSIPYAPTFEELQDPEHIVVWYVDGQGKITPVTSGKYDVKTGRVTFSTTHFSTYAVAFVQKTFGDLASAAWASREIGILASKGIINGTSETQFNPNQSISRADFLVLLVRTLELKGTLGSRFADVEEGVYYDEALRIARGLGIANGSGDNLFNPNSSITREDMMVLTARALIANKKLTGLSTEADLSKFKDANSISTYATNSVAELVQLGLINGYDQAINPKKTTTRAETAKLMYSLYNF